MPRDYRAWTTNGTRNSPSGQDGGRGAGQSSATRSAGTASRGALRGRRPLEPTFVEQDGPSVEAVALYTLRPSVIWRALRRQPASYWFISLYLLFEYVRPQQIYDALRGPPYPLATILLATITTFFEGRAIRFRTPEMLLTAFSCIVLASSAAAVYPSISFSYDNVALYFSWVLIYLIIVTVVDTEERFLIFMLAFLLYSFKMSQHATLSWARDGFAFRNWGATGAPGWFENSGEFGIQMCVFLPLVVAFIVALGKYWPRWLRLCGWMIAASAVTGIVASSSRGALLGLAGVTLWMLTKSRRKLRAFVVTAAFAYAVVAMIPAAQKARFERAGADVTSVSRTDNWRDGLEMMEEHPALGIGYANWRMYHLNHYGSQLLPHNIFVQAGAELGYSGLVAFVALIGCTFAVNRKTRRRAAAAGERGHFTLIMAHGLDGALVGYLVSGSFVTVLYYPFFWINLAMTVALHRAGINSDRDASLVASDSMPVRLMPNGGRRLA